MIDPLFQCFISNPEIVMPIIVANTNGVSRLSELSISSIRVDDLADFDTLAITAPFLKKLYSGALKSPRISTSDHSFPTISYRASSFDKNSLFSSNSVPSHRVTIKEGNNAKNFLCNCAIWTPNESSITIILTRLMNFLLAMNDGSTWSIVSRISKLPMTKRWLFMKYLML